MPVLKLPLILPSLDTDDIKEVIKSTFLSGWMYLNICCEAWGRFWQCFLCTCRRRMMKTISVNYIMSQLMRLNPKFPGLLSQKELTSTIRTDLQSPLDLCCFFFTGTFLLSGNLHIYQLIVVWHPLIYFFPPLSAWCKRMSSNVPHSAACDFGRWEICWGSTLIWKCGHKFSLYRFHSLIVTSLPSPPLLGLHPLTVALTHTLTPNYYTN